MSKYNYNEATKIQNSSVITMIIIKSRREKRNRTQLFSYFSYILTKILKKFIVFNFLSCSNTRFNNLKLH